MHRPAAEPTHTHVQRHLAPYFANERPSAERTRVAAHPRDCLACTAALVRFLPELRATTALLGSLPLHPAPLVLRQQLLAIPDRQPGGSARGERVCLS
jgi:hypothetical protein